MPRVSVVIPAYNAAQCVAKAVESALGQTYTDYEIIVVDDGSTDDTRAVLQPYSDRIRYFYQQNKGRSGARNAAIRQARGEYIAFLDADDYWLADKLEKQVALLDEHPDLSFVFAWAEAFDARGKVWRKMGTTFPQKAADGMDAFVPILTCSPPTLTVVARTCAILTAGMFDEQVKFMEDWDLWLRLALIGRVGFVPKVLAHYRLSGAFMPARLAAAGVQVTTPYVVNKVFDLAEKLQAGRSWEALRRRSLARAHFHSALIEYAMGNVERAHAHLAESASCDAGMYTGKEAEWTQTLADFAVSLYDTFTPPAEASRFLDTFFSSLPASFQQLRSARRQVYRTVAAGHGFRAWAGGEAALARRYLLAAVARYPELGRNRGIWSIIAHSLGGPR